MESCFFYGLNLAHKVHLLTESFSKRYKREKSAVEGKETAGKKLFENMKNEDTTVLFFENFIGNASKFDCINNPFLLRKRKSRRNDELFQNSF